MKKENQLQNHRFSNSKSFEKEKDHISRKRSGIITTFTTVFKTLSFFMDSGSCCLILCSFYYFVFDAFFFDIMQGNVCSVQKLYNVRATCEEFSQ